MANDKKDVVKEPTKRYRNISPVQQTFIVEGVSIRVPRGDTVMLTDEFAEKHLNLLVLVDSVSLVAEPDAVKDDKAGKGGKPAASA